MFDFKSLSHIPGKFRNQSRSRSTTPQLYQPCDPIVKRLPLSDTSKNTFLKSFQQIKRDIEMTVVVKMTTSRPQATMFKRMGQNFNTKMKALITRVPGYF